MEDTFAAIKGVAQPHENILFHNQMEKYWFIMVSRLNASATAVKGTRVGWIKFREHGKVLYGRKLSRRLKKKWQYCEEET